MNKRIKWKHYVRFAESVMYYREEGLEWCRHEKAKPVGGKAAKRCWQYALQCGHKSLYKSLFGVKPVFIPEKNMFSPLHRRATSVASSNQLM